MVDPTSPARVIRLAAIISASLTLCFLLFMLIGHLTGHANGPNGMTFTDRREFIAFLFFPCLSIVGLALAFKWELVGGILILLSLAGLFAVMPALMRTGFRLFSMPAVFHLWHWWMGRRNG